MGAISGADLINRLLGELGLLPIGNAVDAATQQNALSSLNDLLESWSLESLMVVADVEESQTLTSGTAEYTVGNITGSHTGSDNASVLTDANLALITSQYVGGTITNDTDGSSGTVTANTATTVTATLAGGTDNDWDTDDEHTLSGDFDANRPLDINNDVFIRDSAGIDRPVAVEDISVYRARSVKTTSGRPWMLSYQPEFPLGRFSVYPTPNNSTDVLHYRVRTLLLSFANLAAKINFPPGYTRALVKNGAMEVAVRNGKEPNPLLVLQAQQSKEVIILQNSEPMPVASFPELHIMTSRHGRHGVTGGNILTGR